MTPTTTYRVFIADDDEDDRFLLDHAFKKSSPGSQLMFAEDGRALLDTLAQTQHEPCLIILDLNMPRLGGLEALKILRDHPRYQDIPIVVLTTSSSSEDRNRAMALGADDFITKPMNLAVLGRVVARLREEWSLDKCA